MLVVESSSTTLSNAILGTIEIDDLSDVAFLSYFNDHCIAFDESYCANRVLNEFQIDHSLFEEITLVLAARP